MFEWISLRATAAAPCPASHGSSHWMMYAASCVSNEPCLSLKESSAYMPTFKDVTVSVEASIEGGVRGGSFLRVEAAAVAMPWP